MKFYFLYMRNICKQGLVYRFDYIMRIIGSIIALIVNYYIWKALLGQGTDTSIDFDFGYMVTYITISAIIKSFVKSGTISEINQKIRSGGIAMDLIKPYHFISITFCSKVAKAIYQFVFFSIPLLLFSFIFMGIHLPKMIELFWGVISTMFGFIIMFLIEYILGLLGFWFQQTWILERFLNDFIYLLSGATLPLWIFPKSIQFISRYLPFQYIYYEPITVFLGNSNSKQIVNLLTVQMSWMAVLFGGCFLLWRKSVHKITIQGG